MVLLWLNANAINPNWFAELRYHRYVEHS